MSTKLVNAHWLCPRLMMEISFLAVISSQEPDIEFDSLPRHNRDADDAVGVRQHRVHARARGVAVSACHLPFASLGVHHVQIEIAAVVTRHRQKKRISGRSRERSRSPHSQSPSVKSSAHKSGSRQQRERSRSPRRAKDKVADVEPATKDATVSEDSKKDEKKTDVMTGPAFVKEKKMKWMLP